MNKFGYKRGGYLGKVNSAKTHCPLGHPYDRLNTYIDYRGRRRCKICLITSQREHRERRRKGEVRLVRIRNAKDGMGQRGYAHDAEAYCRTDDDQAEINRRIAIYAERAARKEPLFGNIEPVQRG